MAECKKNQNLKKCNCSYDPCQRKGICCECLHYHRQKAELPACFFSPDMEKTYDRSIETFVNHYEKGKW
jgi:hypothetical protein